MHWLGRTSAQPPTPAALSLRAPPAQGSIASWTPAVAARAPSWADAHGERLREQLGTSREADTAVRVSVTSLAATSARSYSGLVKQFTDFCRSRDLAFSPATTPTCLLFLASLHDRGTIQPQSASNFVSAINRYHADVFGMAPGPCSGRDVSTFLAGWEQERADGNATVATRDVRVPLPARVALAALQMAADMPDLRLPEQVLRFRALLYVGFGFALMARADTDISLTLDDIGVSDEDIWIRLRSEKGKKRKLERRILRIPASVAHGLLHRVLKRWLAGHAAMRRMATHAGTAWAAQRNFWRMPLDPAWTSSSDTCTGWMGHSLGLLGCAPPLGQTWTSHSLRKGAASAANALNVSLVRICFHGGWVAHGGAVHDYIDPSVMPDAAAAAFFSWLIPIISSTWATTPVATA